MKLGAGESSSTGGPRTGWRSWGGSIPILNRFLFRMILKDLETCQSGEGNKQMKKELMSHDHVLISSDQRPTSATSEHGLRVDISGDGVGGGNQPKSSPYETQLSNGGGGGGIGSMGAPSSLILRNLTQQSTSTTAANLLQVSSAAAAAVAQRTLNNMIPPLPRLLGNSTVTSAGNNGVNEMPSQPQPQLVNPLSANSNPMLSAVAAAAAANNLILPSSNDFINITGKPSDFVNPHPLPFSHNNGEWHSHTVDAALTPRLHSPSSTEAMANHLVDWQTNLLSNYQNSANNSFAGTSGIGTSGVPPISLGNRQGSASLTSLSGKVICPCSPLLPQPIDYPDNDNNDSSRKRQVRLLKNRYERGVGVVIQD